MPTSPPNFLQPNWMDLPWSDWYPFYDYPSRLTYIPGAPGIYRVRPISRSCLAYIGQTTNLRSRMRQLIPTTLQEIMPYNDPHTAAPGLWAWHDAEGLEYEVSVVGVQDSKQILMARECYLLWQYRLEQGESTMCNHGRFHPNYSRSRNRGQGFRGERLPEGVINPAGGPSHPPLIDKSWWLDNDWMGLHWTPFSTLMTASVSSVPGMPGVYKISNHNQTELFYIGQSANLQNRLRTHLGRTWASDGALFSYYAFESSILHHQLLEIENDLLGAHFGRTDGSSRDQFQVQ
jgi:hypothetical protein